MLIYISIFVHLHLFYFYSICFFLLLVLQYYRVDRIKSLNHKLSHVQSLSLSFMLQIPQPSTQCYMETKFCFSNFSNLLNQTTSPAKKKEPKLIRKLKQKQKKMLKISRLIEIYLGLYVFPGATSGSFELPQNSEIENKHY